MVDGELAPGLSVSVHGSLDFAGQQPLSRIDANQCLDLKNTPQQRAREMLLWYSNERADDDTDKGTELVSSLLRKRTTTSAELECMERILELNGAKQL